MRVAVRAAVIRWTTSALVATAAIVAATSCNRAPAPAPPQAASNAPLGTAAQSAATPAVPALARRKSPADARKLDEAACSGGEVAACRRMADRYRGYGASAGCGLDRGRAGPSIKRVAEDTDADHAAFVRAIRRACDLGDAEACALERIAGRATELSTATAEDARVKSSLSGSALWRWARETRPEHAALLDNARKQCLTRGGGAWFCNDLAVQVYRRDAKPKKELGEAVRKRALAICETTLECSDVLMMLDKELYPVAEVTPVREAMAKTLVEACLDGACVCGEAARLSPLGDPDRAALARAGCDNGEAEGCFELARAHEEGRGVAKDEALALSLYELSCPPMRPLEGQPGPRQGEYSPRACDRLAARHERGQMPPKQRRHAFYYANAACQRPGFERDHAPCLRLSRYHGLDKNTGRNLEDAHIASLGPVGDPVHRKECTRPSVEAACGTLEEEISRVRR